MTLKTNFILIVTCLIFLLTGSSNADDKIKLKLHQPPPNQLNASSLWKLDVTNTTNEDIVIYITGTATEEKDGLIVEGSTKVFNVKPGKKTYGYNDFKEGNVAWKNRTYEEAIIRTGSVQSGTYIICVTAFFENGSVADNEQCITQVIEHLTKGMITLVSPADGEGVAPEAPPGFVWAGVGLKGPYSLRIVELKGDQSPETAIKENRAILEKNGIKTTTYQYSPADPKLKPGVKYAWMVTGNEVESDVFTFFINSNIDMKLDSMKISCTDNPQAYNFDMWVSNTTLLSTVWKFHGIGIVSTIPSVTVPNFSGSLTPSVLQTSGVTPPITGSISTIDINPGQIHVYGMLNVPNTAFSELVILHWYHQNSSFMIPGSYSAFDTVDFNPCGNNCCDHYFEKVTNSGAVYNGTSSTIAPVFYSTNPIVKITADVVSCYKTIYGPGCSPTTAPVYPKFLSASMTGFTSALPYSGEALLYNTAGVMTNNTNPLNLDILFGSPTALPCHDLIKFCIRYTFTDTKCHSCDTVLCYEVKRDITGRLEEDSYEKFTIEEIPPDVPEAAGFLYETPFVNAKLPVLPDCPGIDPNIESSFTINPNDSDCIDRVNQSGSNYTTNNNCLYACENSYVTYTTTLNSGSTYFWTVTGSVISFSGQGTNTIVVLWGASGTGTVTLTETNTGCSETDNICVNIIETPIAQFTPSATSICFGQTVYFTNTSLNALDYYWDFGDGTSSTSFSPSITYSASGTYTVTLVAVNECGCLDSAQVQIIVDPGTGPDIKCPGTVCAGAVETYYTTFNCSSPSCYIWTVTGAASWTVSADGKSINVTWGAGPTGTITLEIAPGCTCTPAITCPHPTTVTIPIIPTVPVITGPTIICANDYVIYSLPVFPGTYYTWTVTNGTIVTGQNTNEIEVHWLLANGSVTVTIHNIILDCGGTNTINVTVLPEFDIAGPLEACPGTTSTYNSYLLSNGTPVLCDWTVTVGTITGSATNTSSINVTWTATGPQTVTAVPSNPANYCNSSAVINVNIPFVQAPLSITGPVNICPGVTYTYTAVPAPDNNPVIWQVTGGTIIGSPSANPVTVTWSGSGTISVSHVSTASPYCESLPISAAVNTISFIPITGPSNVCVDNTTQYQTNFVPNVDYQWSISPANAGSITTVPMTNLITVVWSGIAGVTTPYTATVTLNACGTTLTYPVTVNPALNPVVTAAPSCTGTLLSLTLPYTTYTWKDENGNVVGTGATYNALSEGLYFVTVSDGICSGTSNIFVNAVTPQTALISTPGPISYCTGSAINTMLYVTANSNFNSSTYQWFLNFVPAGTGPSLNATATGTYTLQVYDLQGCLLNSNSIVISEDPCIPGSGTGGCIPQPFTADFTWANDPADCSIINFTPGSFSNFTFTHWSYGHGPDGTTLSHTYPTSGYYTAAICGTVPAVSGGTCNVCVPHPVTVPIAANFEFDQNCNIITVTDLSTNIPTSPITSTVWSYRLVPGAFTPFAPPSFTITSTGTYEIKLVISNGSCQSEKILSFSFTAPPVPAFTFAPSPACVNTSIIFSSPAGMAEYLWNFGDNSEAYTQNPVHTYTIANTYTVTLTVIDFNGCTQTVTQNIIINPLPSLSITPSGTIQICEGSSQVLTAPASLSYQWFDVNGPISGETLQNYLATQSGTYHVQVTTLNNCIVTTPPVTVVVNPNPEAIITPSPDPNVCCFPWQPTCSQVTFTAFDGGGYNFAWQLDGSSVGTNSPVLTINIPAGAHTISLTVTDPVSGCTDTETLPVNNSTPPYMPYITITSTVPVCEGENIDLAVSSPDPTLTYIWSTGQTGTSITVTNAGSYSVTAYNAAGCSAVSNVINIHPDPDPVLFPVGCDSLCDTTNLPGPIAPTGTAYSDTYIYQWYLNGTPIPAPEGTSQELDVNPLQSGSYTLLIVSSAGCSTLAGPYDIITYPCGEIITVPPDICCKESQITLQSSLTYLYNDEHTLNATFTYSPFKVKRVITTILGANISSSSCGMNGEQWAYFYNAQSISGNITSFAGPTMPVSYVYPREVIWGSNTGTYYDLSSPSAVKLGIKVPMYFWCTDNLTLDIKYSFLDSTCQICDTVITYRINRKGKIKPWWSINFSVLTGEEDPINKSLNAAREKLAGTEIGKMAEDWYGRLENTDWADKLLKDENKLRLAKELIKIGRRVAVEGGKLEKEDLGVIEKSLKAIEEAGLSAPEGLIEKVMDILKSSTGKTWNDIINKMSGDKKDMKKEEKK